MKRKLGIISEEIFFGENFLDPLDLKYTLSRRSNWRYMLGRYTGHEFVLKLPETESWLTQYTNVQFFQLFRMVRGTYEKLVLVIERADDKKILKTRYAGGYRPIGLKTQVLIFIWYMSTQDSLMYIGNRFKVYAATVMTVVNKMLYFLLILKTTYIQFPQTEADMLEISRNFGTYPGVVGALDGTHIFIKVPLIQQDSYIDRYRRHSINIMAVCDANNVFTYVFVGYPGSAHDSRVFENSQLYLNIERHGPNSVFIDDRKYHLVGDKAFGLKTWLMTPFKGNNLTRKQKKHNFHLSSSRVRIEHTFGLLKGRWRRLQFINTYNIFKTVEIATAACVLHNFCILNVDNWDEEYVDIYTPPENNRRAAEDAEAGIIKRYRISNSLFYK